MTEESALKGSARSGLIWGAGFTLASDLIQFATMLLLVRLLSPAIYGQQAIAQAIIGLLGVASLKSIAQFALQQRDPTSFDWSKQFSVGATLNLIILAIAVAIGLTMIFVGGDYEIVGLVVLALAPVFLIDAFAAYRLSWLQAHHDWARMRVLMLTGALFGSAGGVIAALMGWGVYSLAIMPSLAGVPATLDLLASSGTRPTYSFGAITRYADGLRFGANRVLGQAAYAARALAENTAMSAFYGFATVGSFNRAVGLAQITSGRVGPVAVQTLFSVLTRAEAASARFRRFSTLLFQGVVWISAPAALFIAMESPAIVNLLYGEDWTSVIPLLPLACLLLALRGASTTIYHAMLANLQTSHCLRIDILVFLVGIGAIAFMPTGVMSYMTALIAIEPFVFAATLTMAARGGAVSPGDLLKTALPCGLSCLAALGVSAVLLPTAATLVGLPLILHLLVKGGMFAIVYASVLCIAAPKATEAILDFLPVPRNVRFFLAPLLQQFALLRR